MTHELVIEDVRGGYGEVQILFGISLSAPSGRLTAVVGPNGCGKSTLMRCVAGLLPVTSGRIVFDGEDIAPLVTAERVQRGISFVPQERSLFPNMSVRENLLLGAWRWRGTAAARKSLDQAYESLPQVREWANLPAGVLSGGQQRIVELARALVAGPQILVLDEPTAGVAPAQVGEVLAHLRRLVDERGVGVLLVEQNLPEAVAVSDHVYGLVTGRNDIDGPATEIGADLEGLVRRWLAGSEGRG